MLGGYRKLHRVAGCSLILVVTLALILPSWIIASAQQRNIGTNIQSDKKFYETALQDSQAKWKEQGLFPSIGDMVGQMIPFLPWWRQAQALDRPFHGSYLPGQTIRENISYMYALPPESRKIAYDKAMAYLEGHNLLDALTFAQAMVSFSTNDKYRANAFCAFQIAFLPLIGFLAIRRMVRTGMPQKIRRSARSVQDFSRSNCVLLGTIALGILVIGFLASEGYVSSFGILGSLPHMHISFGFFVVPFRPVAAISLLLLLYSAFLFINGRANSSN